MEKLIMLIDIYEEEVVWVHSIWEKITDKEEARIISKKFWFIKWLVENEKIDYKKIEKKIWIEEHKAEFPITQYWYVYDMELWSISSGDYSDYESLLMLLSISNSPIEDLILYLE